MTELVGMHRPSYSRQLTSPRHELPNVVRCHWPTAFTGEDVGAAMGVLLLTL